MKILSIDCGIKTLAICLININKIPKKQMDYIFKITNNIQKGCNVLEPLLTEEQSLRVQLLLMEVKDLRKTAIEKTFEIIDWEKINLFPIPEELKNLTCSKCKRKATFYKKTNEIITGYCRGHSKNIQCKEIKEKLVKTIPVKTLCETAVRELDKRSRYLDADVVLIEQQPSKNSRMKNFQNMLYSYFIIRGCVDKNRISNIYFVSPKHKLKSYSDKTIRNKITELFLNSKQKTNYDKNKEVSILLTHELLKRDKTNIKWLELLKKNHSKMDDLCDSFLQALSYSDFL